MPTYLTPKSSPAKHSSEFIPARFLSLLPLLLLSFSGCSDGTSSSVWHQPAEAAALALKTYDANSDGQLDAQELGSCPALNAALSRIDANRDGTITAEEIQQRLEKHRTQSDYVGTNVRLTLGGAPLAEATVTFELEPFLGENLPTYSGKSNNEGTVTLQSSAKPTPGLPLGFYQVHIQRIGNEAEVIRGCEIADDVPDVNRLLFAL